MSTRVILVTGGLEINEISAVINAGVSGIFLKNNDPRQLMKAIQRIAEGEHWWDTDILRALALAREKPIGQASNGRPLTQRQARVLRGVLDGFTNKEIAVQMQVSESAIKATIQELFSKAGVKTRSQLVRVAIEKHSTDWPTAD